MKLVPPKKPISYPDGDGKPMAENTLQFEWIVTIKENIEALFANDPNVFVAGDLFWYPVEGHPEICQAPDTLVAFGRPHEHRGSYRQWVEDGIAPQVVFEILSPGNRAAEMAREFKFYETYGVEEYYIYDPDDNVLTGWRLQGNELVEIAAMNGWTSPRLGIRFDCGDPLVIRNPDGSPFLTAEQLFQLRDRLSRERDEAERKLAVWEKDRVIAERDCLVAQLSEMENELAELRARLPKSS